METKTKRISISILQFIVLEISSFFIQKSLTINTDKIMIKEIIDNAIMIGTSISILLTCVLWIRWKYLDLYAKIKQLKIWIDKSYVIHKYYDLMLIKAQSQNRFNDILIYDEDLNCFTENEKKYLKSYFEDIEQLRIYKKGTNKTLGQF